MASMRRRAGVSGSALSSVKPSASFPYPTSGTGGPVSSVTVVGALNDVATADLAPAIVNGQNIPLDTAGWVLLIQCNSVQTIADATKLTVSLTAPANSTTVGAAPTTRSDVAYGVKLLRRAFPNHGSPLLPGAANAFYITIDRTIHTPDVINSIVLAPGFFTGQTTAIPIGSGLVTNSSSLAYDQPFATPLTAPFRLNPPEIEYGAAHSWASFGQQVARVEHRWKSGASYGAWTGSGVQVRSNLTPASGRMPSGIPAPAYICPVDWTGCPQSTARDTVTIVYRVFGHWGDVLFDSEIDGAALGTNGIRQSPAPPAALPVIRRTDAAHNPIYAWINRDGTAGGSAAIQTGTSDPGAAASYASENAALVAARAYNNANRGHNTTSGIVLLFRDVAGGSLGNSNLAYWQRATLSGFSDGLVPPVLASASYLASGNTTLDCRRRGVQDDGTTVATSKVMPGVWEFRGITFDSIGLTGTNHIITNGTTAHNTLANAVCHTIMFDCDIRENSAAGSSFGAINQPGWWYQYRCDVGGLNAGEGPPGPTAMGVVATLFAGMVVQVGCLYSRGAVLAAACVPTAQFGCWFRNLPFVGQAVGAQPSIEYAMMQNVRIDCAAPTSALIELALRRPVYKGMSLVGIFARMTGTYNGPMIRFGGDASQREMRNFSVQHFAVDGGFDTDTERKNGPYNEQTYIQILKQVSERACAWGPINLKDDVFPGGSGEILSALASGWAATATTYRGDMVHDNNATTSARVYYIALSDFTTGSTQATDLADTAKWLNLGARGAENPSAQPLRTGTWRTQHAVNCRGSVATRTSNGDTNILPASQFGEAVPRGGAFNGINGATVTWADYYKRRSGGTLSTFTDWGDYRPASTAAGDSVNSPLLLRVAANEACLPFDLLGVTRRNDGTGAAGAYERSA